MEDHCLIEHLNKIDFFLEDEEQECQDDNDYLNIEPFSVQEGQEPELHSSPFEFDKEDLPTQDKTTESESQTQISEPSVNLIEFSNEKIPLYHESFYGSKNDTVELNTNFKTLLVNYFRQLIFLKELTPQETQNVEKYAQRVPSFNSLKKFYQDKAGNEGIRMRCMEFFQGSECLRRIMKGRCRLKTKLMMIKFIEKMRSNLLEPGVVKWKDRISWRESEPI